MSPVIEGPGGPIIVDDLPDTSGSDDTSFPCDGGTKGADDPPSSASLAPILDNADPPADGTDPPPPSQGASLAPILD